MTLRKSHLLAEGQKRTGAIATQGKVRTNPTGVRDIIGLRRAPRIIQKLPDIIIPAAVLAINPTRPKSQKSQLFPRSRLRGRL